MTARSRIEYTHTTWNPVTGCTKISAGCTNCYAERMARRLHAMGSPNYVNGFELTLHPQMLDQVRTWRKPRMVFVNSMSDLFHKDVPFEFIRKLFEVMTDAPQHIFQILTKRSGRLLKLSPRLNWPENVWMGVTCESKRFYNRIDDLRLTSAYGKFLSLEPLLSSLPGLDLQGIDWAIVGGESGPGARPMEKEWVLDIQGQCREQAVAFFFKQWGGVNKKKTGNRLNGRLCQQYPDKLLSHAAQAELAL
ncbi:MAG: phage Gp37/Gp68 family protein [candidate division Zixibacteria bacterium]|nr:phage Gp37/Gp68 family protein [candidate division Zixibacteria bacterium]MDH3936627.1 phage Gp37/Gp68 family protein [candidate division Zixibacteria bacterium]MDH4034833.1 phage Gp37/Gp68 family protein [candidate division Zixibacteria bacterium]